MLERIKHAWVYILSVVCVIGVLSVAVATNSVNTFVVYDGGNVVHHASFSSDASKVLNTLGITLGEDDTVSYPESEIDGVYEIRVNRAFDLPVLADGTELTVRVNADNTVAQALEKAGIVLGAQDKVSLALDAKVSPDAPITVTRYISYKTEELVTVAYQSETRKNPSLDSGTKKVIRAGKNGQKKQYYQVIVQDGVTTKTLLREEVISEPVNKIVSVGTRAVVSGPGTISRGGAPIRYKKAIKVTATAYTTERQKHKRTATGAIARVGLIAVDPKVIPLGTRMYITSVDGKSWIYGTAVAADTGGAIKGNKIDLFFDTHHECVSFGRRQAMVYILE